jgi:hypothetical protein
MNKHLLKIMLLLLAGCSGQSYRPSIDEANDPNAYRLKIDLEECGMLAKQAGGDGSSVSSGRTTAIATDMFLGASTGATYGAQTSDPSTYIGVGAAVGAASSLLGAMSRSEDDSPTHDEGAYRSAYNSCMRARGHTVR